MKKLDHKNLGKALSFSRVKNEIDALICDLDQKHYLQRKIKFLLDIRGYLKVNNIRGSYVEFGSFKSEMQYSAFRILEGTRCIKKYIGLDAFDNKLDLSEKDKQHNSYESPDDFLCSYDNVKIFVDEEMGEKGLLVRGDFRKKEVQVEFRKISGPISVAVMDCNFISSTRAALQLLSEAAVPGCVLFLDDYFTNFRKGIPAIPNLVDEFFESTKFELVDLGFYPPFAKSFLLVERGK